MYNNAHCHRAIAVQCCPQSKHIHRIMWAIRSLDLNRIENVWNGLRWRLIARPYTPIKKLSLTRAAKGEWDKLPQNSMDHVVQSVSRRVGICIVLHGGYILYWYVSPDCMSCQIYILCIVLFSHQYIPFPETTCSRTYCSSFRNKYGVMPCLIFCVFFKHVHRP